KEEDIFTIINEKEKEEDIFVIINKEGDNMIVNYNLNHISNEIIKLDIQLDILRNTENCDLLQFPDKAYSKFMELISKYHISNSAGDDILKWFHLIICVKKAKIPKNTIQEQ
ncbi:15037_t:CDS:1, partial [Funneliformis caledonium]